MSRPSESIRELEDAISEFVLSFELVFDDDWDMTQNCIADTNFIEARGTFIRPGVADEGNNWGNRGSLLASYRRLQHVLTKYTISHSIDDE